MLSKIHFAIRYKNKLKYFKSDRPIHLKHKTIFPINTTEPITIIMFKN